jgi:tetraacyldisaccharide 4'-kinase
MQHLSQYRLGYVSRGYGRSDKTDIVCYGDVLSCSYAVGDEAFLLAQRDPSILFGIGSSKRKMIKKLEKIPLDIIFLDDGLQRYDVESAFEIGVLPEKLLFEKEHVFPAGILREPLGRLKQVDLLFVIKENPCTPLSAFFDELKKQGFSKYVLAEQQCAGFKDVHGFSVKPCQKKVALFTAIARPERVVTLLKSQGYDIVDTFCLGDHASLLSKEFSEWAIYWQRKGVTVLGTEKDWARHVPWPKNLYFCLFLQVDLAMLSGEDIFAHFLNHVHERAAVV